MPAKLSQCWFVPLLRRPGPGTDAIRLAVVILWVVAPPAAKQILLGEEIQVVWRVGPCAGQPFHCISACPRFDGMRLAL